MPVTPTYPGVYVTEIPSGVRTITGVATSITAFIGRAARGPVDDPVLINSFGDFERTFGGLWAQSTLGYAVRDYYLNGGSQAIIVRLYHQPFDSAADETQAGAAATETAAAAAGADASAAVKAVTDKAATYPGEPQRSAAESVAQAARTAAQAGATAADVKKAADDKAAGGSNAAQETAAAATGTSAAAAAAAAQQKAATYETDADKAAAKEVADAAVAASTAGATPDDVKNAALEVVAYATPGSTALLKIGDITLQAASPGSWGNALQARVDYDVLGPDAANLFNLYVRDSAIAAIETFRNVSIVAGGPRQVDKVLENESLLIRVAGALPKDRPAQSADPDQSKGESDVWADNAVATNAKVDVASQASDGRALGVDDFNGNGMESGKQGLYSLLKADLFNILCIPPYLDSGDVDNNSLVDLAAQFCEQHRAILLLDPPTTWTSTENVRKNLTGLGTASANAAVFFPRLSQPDPLREGQMADFAPCGAVAGIFARTDSNRGVWKAPAGLDAILTGVPQLSVSLTDQENGELNPLGVNCLRTMPAAGRVVWGARTLQGDDRLASEWKYIPVRRTAMFIEESLYRGTQWVVFEPNDEPLWAQVRLNVGGFMQNLFRQGAFQGKTPQEAYFVKCDRETTTQDDINRGVVNIVVGFAPLKPAEFVIIGIQQIAGQIQA